MHFETNSDKNYELALMTIKSALEHALKDQTEESKQSTMKVSSPTIILSILTDNWGELIILTKKFLLLVLSRHTLPNSRSHTLCKNTCTVTQTLILLQMAKKPLPHLNHNKSSQKQLTEPLKEKIKNREEFLENIVHCICQCNHIFTLVALTI